MQGSNVRPGRRGLNFSWRVDLREALRGQERG